VGHLSSSVHKLWPAEVLQIRMDGFKFVNQFLNAVYKTAKDVNTCSQENGLPDS